MTGRSPTGPGSHASHGAAEASPPTVSIPSAVMKFLKLVHDFGSMSTGQFRAKYSDCGCFEGYGYIERKAAALSKMLGGAA